MPASGWRFCFHAVVTMLCVWLPSAIYDANTEKRVLALLAAPPAKGYSQWNGPRPSPSSVGCDYGSSLAHSAAGPRLRRCFDYPEVELSNNAG